MTDRPDLTKAQRIAAARAALAAAYAADPAAVRRFEARRAALTAAAKRERERFETKVLGRTPDPEPIGPRPAGMGRAAWKIEKERRRQHAIERQSPAARWAGKEGTPETLERASRAHQGALRQLYDNGVIDAEQLEWAAEIANVHRSIESDVSVAVASLEARVDQSRSAIHLVGEGVKRVRMHAAYTAWRKMLPAPKQLVLDMVVGDTVGYSVAARRHRVHPRKAKRYLLLSLDRWPACVDEAHRTISRDDVDRANAAERSIGHTDAERACRWP